MWVFKIFYVQKIFSPQLHTLLEVNIIIYPIKFIRPFNLIKVNMYIKLIDVCVVYESIRVEDK